MITKTWDDEEVVLKDSPQLDAFGRLRVSFPITLFDSQLEYGLCTLSCWDATANGTLAAGSTNASVSSGGNAVGPRDSNTRMCPITVSTVSGDYAVLQSKVYWRYIPGKSHLVLMTGIFSPGVVADTDARAGYFDSANGCFLKVTEGVASVVLRTSTSGSVVDNAVLQSAWNIDPMDGYGPSGVTLDLTKTQILYIQAQWLGVGRVTIGFDVDGILYPVHQFLNANSQTTPYTQTWNLPVRMELRNTGTSAGGTVYFNCASVQSEGAQDARGAPWTAPTGIVTKSVTTRRPIMSIRPKATFNSLTNRAHIEELEFLLRVLDNDSYFEIVVNGTLTGDSFASVATDSVVEYDTSATAISGGIVIESGFAVTNGEHIASTTAHETDARRPLVLSQIDALTATQSTITLVCTSFSGTSRVTAVANWHEQVT